MVALVHTLVFWRWELIKGIKSVHEVWITAGDRQQRYFILFAGIMDFVHVVIESLVHDDAPLGLSIVKRLQLHFIIESNGKSIRLRQHNTVIIEILCDNVRVDAHIEVDEYFLRATICLLFAILLLFERHKLIGLNDNML